MLCKDGDSGQSKFLRLSRRRRFRRGSIASSLSKAVERSIRCSEIEKKLGQKVKPSSGEVINDACDLKNRWDSTLEELICPRHNKECIIVIMDFFYQCLHGFTVVTCDKSCA